MAADVGAGRGRIPAARAGRRAVTWRSTSRSSRPTTASCSANNGRHRDIQPVPQRAPADPGPATPRTTTTCLRPWSGPGVPHEAVELAVLCEDPDASCGTFNHWVLAGLQPTAPGLAEGRMRSGPWRAATTSARRATAAPCRRSGTAPPVLLPGVRRLGAAGAGSRGIRPGPARCLGERAVSRRYPGRHLPALTASPAGPAIRSRVATGHVRRDTELDGRTPRTRRLRRRRPSRCPAGWR